MSNRLPLTKLQKEVYDFIRNYQKKFMLSPSANKIAEEKEFSRSNAYAIIERLQKKGWITKNSEGAINKIES